MWKYFIKKPYGSFGFNHYYYFIQINKFCILYKVIKYNGGEEIKRSISSYDYIKELAQKATIHDCDEIKNEIYVKI